MQKLEKELTPNSSTTGNNFIVKICFLVYFDPFRVDSSVIILKGIDAGVPQGSH